MLAGSLLRVLKVTKMAKGIFISYRRDDTKDAAGRLALHLEHHFDRRQVFIDIAIEAGADWKEKLDHALETSGILLAMIGPHWMDGKRLQDKDDYVRWEIESALARNIHVLPVRVNGAILPKEEELPEGLRALTRQQGEVLRAESLDHGPFGRDADAIAKIIGRVLREMSAGARSAQRRAASPVERQFYAQSGTSSLIEAARGLLLSPQMPPKLTRRIAPDPYLLQDPLANIAQYEDEETINSDIPYVEIVNWCHEVAHGSRPDIEVDLLPHSFVLGSWQPGDGDIIREAAFAHFKSRKPDTFNGPAVRVEDAVATSRKLWLTVQEAKYFDQLRSNLVLDFKYPLPGGARLSLRDLLRQEFGATLPPRDEPRLANTLGVAALIFARVGDEFTPYLVSRSRDTAVFNVGGEWHCTASGVAEMIGGVDGRQEFYRASMLKELDEEVGLRGEDIVALEPVAFCRELMRGGKPQMFFLGVTDLPTDALRAKLRTARRKAKLQGDIVENTAMPLLRKPASITNAEALALYHEKGFTIEAAACLHYYFRCQSAAENRDLSSK
jgi:8-oxo-dGTP pyrophosphatase MutT (NUDIX family)